ncbi:oncostatin-M-specific receptor subunit beta [Brienomyrus brachyistius]|uniref:oncostatin-M-specific receptor subunit beta n=1 Tax=Brienomyrus brachyistius TaxID=42636 RepID=UPI0020B3D96D|nr:oncostatin-M-specific receptor subunit beta [Brienomyrus brachyistius]
MIDDVVANNTTQELSVKWRINLDDDGQRNITFIIQIARGKNLSKVYETIVHFDRNIGDGTLQWKWISEWPLQCTDHSVRIKRLSDSFAANWSQWKTNSGVRAPDDEPRIFPFQQLLREGSSGHFCCIVPRRGKIRSFTFKHISRPHSLIDEGVYGIIVNNLNRTNEFGILATCEDSNAQKARTLNYVSVPPQKPRNIKCETHDMEHVSCSWDTDTPPSLKYSFTYHCILTLQNATITGTQDMYNQCTFQAMPDQKEYNMTVRVTNSLGEESESLGFLITDIVSPEVQLLAVMPATRHANVSFFVKGNFSRFNLSCQVKTSDGNLTGKETLKGLTGSRYQITVGGLQPLEQYTLLVCCSLVGSARGFGQWISSQRFTTHAEPPSVSLDLWRAVHQSSGTRSVTVMWKIIYNNNNSKTDISAYEVQFGNSKQIVTGQDTNHTSINISLSTCSIAVRAVNEAGSSLPSYIVVPSFRSKSVTSPKAKRVSGYPVQGIPLSWEACDWATCGYTVDWSKATEPNQVVNWVKVPVGSTNLTLSAEWFEPGCRYTFRVFGCHGNEHVLAEAFTGYAEELEPRRKPTLNPVSISSSSALLSWEFNDDDPADPGFITGYRVTVNVTDSLQLVFREQLNDLHIKKVIVEKLRDGTKYTFGVQAYTKAGFGPPDETTATSPSNHTGLLIQLLIPLLLLLGAGILVSYYSKRIKAHVGPFFFTPVKLTARKLEMSSSLYEVSEKIKALKVEDCPCSSIDVLEESSMEKHQMMDTKIQGSQVPYAPQSPSNSLCGHVNSGISGITNMTYFSTSEPLPNYIVVDSPAGSLEYITTTDMLC